MKNRILSLILAILCVITTIPFTSFAVSAADVEYSSRVLEAEDVSGFEPPYDPNGNFDISGVSVEDMTFDGQSVKAYSKTADKITAVRGDETKEDYTLNLYSYDVETDSKDRVVRMYDAQYIAVDYYYDTTGRDESDEFGAELAGNVMRFNSLYYYQTGTKTDFYKNFDSAEPIVANQWATAVFNQRDAVNMPELFALENADTYSLGQWSLHPFGYAQNQQMYKGDVFYIKSIRFLSYDPSNPPSKDRKVIFYLTQNDYLEDEPAQGRFLKLEGTKDLDTFVFPDPEDENSGFERLDGQRFSHWLRIDYGTKHYPGEEFSIIDGNDAYFSGVYIKPQTITFNYNGDKLVLDECYRGDTIIIPELPNDAVEPDNKKFYGWKDNIEGKIYMPGDEYLYSDIRVGFDAFYSNLVEVTFTAPGVEPITRNWYENTSYVFPDCVKAPEGKIFAGWTAGGQRHYAGAEYYFSGEYLEYTAEFVDRGTITFDFKALYTEGQNVISGFEAPYAADGNYTLQGIKTEVTTFDGQSVKAFSKTADKITATRDNAPTTKEDYSLNLYGYGRQYDSVGNAISMLDASYVSVEYYYDTTGRDTSDVNGQELTGKQMVYSQENVNGSWVGISASSDPIVADSWQKAVIVLKDSPNAGSYFDPAKESDYYMDSYKLYLFGDDRGIQMYKGDVFYVKSIKFTKFDPTAMPAGSRDAAVYLYEEDQEALYEYEGLKDFDKFNLPEVINPGETVNKKDGVVYIDLNDYEIGDFRFANWIRAGYDTHHEPGETILLNDLDDAIFYMNLVPPQEVTFVYDDKSFAEFWFEGANVVFPDLPDDAVIPEGKVFAGWTANGERYYAGSIHEFTAESFEFAPEFVDRGSITFDYKGLYTTGENVISGFEAPYASDGNYTLNGIKTEVTTFDGQSVKAFSKTADKITATRDKAPTTKEDYELNLYGYNQQYDSEGNAISALDASYITVEYYYDTTMRDTSDVNGQDLTGNQIMYSQQNIYENGSSKWVGIKGYSAPIVANSWQRAVISLKDASNAGSYFDADKESSYQLGPWKLYLFGYGTGQQMYKGDVFYVKSIKFTKFNPETAPAGKKNVSFYLNSDDTTALYTYNGLKDLDTFKLPYVINPGTSVEKIDGEVYIDLSNYDIGEYRFAKWVRADYETKHSSGDRISLNNLDNAKFYMSLTAPITVTFDYGNDNVFEKVWYVGDTVKMPQLPEDAQLPEGKVFKGWKAGDDVYSAGANFEFDGSVLTFTAEFVEAAKVYYSSTGSISGVSGNVYTTLAGADAAIAEAGGVGTVYVYGNLPIVEGDFHFTSSDIKILGYDANATVTFSTNNHVTITSATRAKVTFDNIRVIRGKGNTDENWLQIKNTDIVFGSECKFTTATFKDWQQKDVERGLFIANMNTGSGFSVEIGGQTYVDVLAPLGGWSGGAHQSTGDYKFVVNGGTVNGLYLTANNGNNGGQPSVVNGNIEVEINGGSVNYLVLGGNKADKLVGNAIVTINGGTISNLYYGNGGTYNSASTGSIKNLALVYNVKEILASNSSVPTVTTPDYHNNVTNSVFVVNNAELMNSVPTLEAAHYNIQVKGGKATPVFADNKVYFEITVDSTGEGTLFANGKAIEADADGLYTLDKGITVVEYRSADQLVTVKYDNGTEEQILAGANYQLAVNGTDNGNEMFYGWIVDSKFMAPGAYITLPSTGGSVVNIITKRVTANSIIYLNTQSGNDTNDGLTSSTAIKSVDEAAKRLAAFTNGKATVQIVGTLTGDYLALPAYSGVLTIQGGTIKWNGGLNLNSDTVFKNIKLHATGGWQYIGTEMYDLTFDTGVAEASGSQGLYIHAGLLDANMDGDLKVVLNSGTIKEFRVGPYYNATGTSKVWNGNFELIVDGATIGKLEHGDSWGSTTEGGFSINGTEKFIIKSGSVDYMNTHKLSKITGGIQVYDYCHLNFEFNNWDSYNNHIYRFNMHGDINPVSLVNGKLTLDKPARVIGNNRDDQGTTEFSGITAGTYKVICRELTFVGSQIRVDDPAALRFIFKVNGASSVAKENYGMLVYPTELLGDDTLTHDLVGNGKAKDIEVKKIYAEDSTSFSFSVAIYNIKNTAAGYLKEFTVVPYIIEADGSYTYGEAQSHSLYDVAKAATGADADKAFVKAIISTVEASAK